MSAERPRILFVDDDPELLQSLKLLLRKDFRVATATSGAEGLEQIAGKGPFVVVVSDMRMPEMNGAQFLQAVRKAAPNTVRILLTGQTDMNSAISAVNEGAIFRFLTKPCGKEELLLALRAGVAQFRLETAEQDLLQNTLRSSVALMTEILGHVHPQAFSRSSRVHRIVRHMTRSLGLGSAWTFEIASMLSSLGLVTVPPETVERHLAGQELQDWEKELVEKHPEAGAKMVESIPRLEGVGEIIAAHAKFIPVRKLEGPPSGWDPVKLGALLLQVAQVYERVTAEAGAVRALEALRADERFPEALVESLGDFAVNAKERVALSLRLDQLAAGMIANQDIRTTSGTMLASKGQTLDVTFLARLRNFDRGVGVEQPIRVLAPINTVKRPA